MSAFKKVLIFGGTHGNEWTGTYVIKKFAASLAQEFPSLDLTFIEANPEAYKINKRFKDEDLNRAFQFISEDRPGSYEHGLALSYKELIEKEECFLIDLHTTTSNMGNTIIISHPEALNFAIAENLTKVLPDTRVILSPDPSKKYLASQSAFGMMIEVGPVPNGVIDGRALEGTVNLIKEVLRLLSTPHLLTAGKLEIYEEIEDIHYPLDESGEVTAYIHPDFQGKDFFPVKGDYRPFKNFLGEGNIYQTQEELYPIFINEAAYYPTKLAFTLCKKRRLFYTAPQHK